MDGVGAVKLQLASRLALFAVMETARDPARPVTAAEIAARYGVSEHHLAKVLRTLGRAGLLEALRGAGGGFRFRGNPKRVTLIDVVQLFEEVGAREPAGRTGAERALARVLEEIDAITRATLGSITVATLLRLMEPGPGA